MSDVRYVFRFPDWFSLREYSLSEFIHTLQGRGFHYMMSPAAVFGFVNDRCEYTRTIFEYHMRMLIRLAKKVHAKKDEADFLKGMIALLGPDLEGDVEYRFKFTDNKRLCGTYDEKGFMRILDFYYPSIYGLNAVATGYRKHADGHRTKLFEKEIPEQDLGDLMFKSYMLNMYWAGDSPDENLEEFARQVRLAVKR